MKKTLHRFLVKATDDTVVDDYRTRWRLVLVAKTRREAWDKARYQLSRGWRHVQVVEERRYTN